MCKTPERAVVAQFHKQPDGSVELFSLVTEDEEGHRRTWDVDRSRRYGYMFNCSGWGGSDPVGVDGPYHVSGHIKVKESRCQLIDVRDKPPYRGKRTRIVRSRNRTRRLRAVPKAFALKRGQDLLTWLQENAIETESVWCSVCQDRLPDDDLCEHVWWCDTTGWYSTPEERTALCHEPECWCNRQRRRMRNGRNPSMWWDFVYEGTKTFVAVEADDYRYPIIARWRVRKPAHPGRWQSPEQRSKGIDTQIAAAQKLMTDIDAGRLSFDKVAKAFDAKQHKTR